MAYVTKYTVPFRSILNKACEFRIQEDNYSGVSTELTGMVLPVSRSGKGDNDELEDRIIRSECRVMVNSETDYQFINLFTADARKYRGQLYIDSALEWQGFLTPDYYSEPYIPAPYDVALLFTDGLGQLKGKDFTIPYTYNYSNGYMAKLSDILKMCIEETGNLLGYYEAVNIHEENMDTDKSMLIQTYCDLRRFDDLTYYEVLDEILKCANNARLWLQEGKWWIVPINVMKETFNVRSSTDLETVSLVEVNPRITTTNTTATPLNVFLDSPELLMLPAWKKYIVNHDFGYNENIFNLKAFQQYGTVDYDLDGFQAAPPTPGYRSSPSRDYVLEINRLTELGWSTGDYLLYSVCDIETSIYQYLTINFAPLASFSSGTPIASTLRMQIYIKSGNTYRYMQSNGQWSTSTAYAFNAAHTLCPYAIKSNLIPISGRLYVKLFNPYNTNDRASTMTFVNPDDFSIKIESYAHLPESVNITTEINDKQNYIPNELDVLLADPPDCENDRVAYCGGLYYLDGTFKPTVYWLKQGSNDLKKLINLIADEICSNHLRPMSMITGSLRCNFKPGSVIETSVGHDKLFIIKRFTQNFYDDEWECDLVEFAAVDQGYLKLRSGGYVKLRNGNKIKLR